MSIDHNRIKVSDLEKNQPNKILTTNTAGELEFSDINNTLDCTVAGKVLDARQGKILQDGKVDKVAGKSLLSDTEITRLGTLSNYIHPANHPPSIITQDASNRFVTDAEKAAWNAKQSSLGFSAENVANKNVANGYAGLGADGKLISSQLPTLTISDTFVIGSQAAMLAVTAETGDVAVRTDLKKSFILKGTNPTVLSNWQELLTPTPTLQEVLISGHEAIDSNIILNNIDSTVALKLLPEEIIIANSDDTNQTGINLDGFYAGNSENMGVGLGPDNGLVLNQNGGNNSYINNSNVTSPNILLQVPNKPAGSYTIATLDDIPTSAQVNADWNATTGVTQILNKPAIPTMVPQVNADWNSMDGVTRILNKPNIPSIIAHLEYSNTDKTVWNNGKGSFSTSFGDSALRSITTGSGNTAIGVYSSRYITTGSNNTSLGSYSLQSSSGGSSNCTAIGYNALLNSDGGLDNTGVGYGAMRGIENGSYNTCLGSGALQTGRFGNLHTAVGYHSLYWSTDGSGTSALGSQAGKFTAGGVNILQSHTNSIFIGRDTKSLANSQSNEIVIGYNVTGAGSNTISLGNSFITDNYFFGKVRGGSFVSTAVAPTQGVTVGITGEIRAVAGFIYVCSGGTVWTRAALATF
jgi:hypothetical protein